MRGVAALMVVAVHLCAFSLAPIGAIDKTGALTGNGTAFIFAGDIADPFGHAGVDFFFVISGLIMFMVTHRGAGVVDFVKRRVARIYPLYWLTFAAIVLAGKAFKGGPSEMFRELTLIGIPQTHPLAWTLVFEIRFYLVVAVLLLLGRGRIGLMFAIWAVAETAAVAATSYGLLPPTYFTHYLNLEFVMGVGVGALIARRVDIAPRAAFAIGLVAFLFAACYLSSRFELHMLRVWGYGLPGALMLYGLVTLERRGDISVPRLMVAAGEASYSLYLWHFPVFLMMQRFWYGRTWIDGVGFMLTAFAVLVVVAHYSYRWIERPLVSAVSRRS